jgi:hypothetical protein
MPLLLSRRPAVRTPRPFSSRDGRAGHSPPLPPARRAPLLCPVHSPPPPPARRAPLLRWQATPSLPATQLLCSPSSTRRRAMPLPPILYLLLSTAPRSSCRARADGRGIAGRPVLARHPHGRSPTTGSRRPMELHDVGRRGAGQEENRGHERGRQSRCGWPRCHAPEAPPVAQPPILEAAAMARDAVDVDCPVQALHVLVDGGGRCASGAGGRRRRPQPSPVSPSASARRRGQGQGARWGWEREREKSDF